MSVPGHEQTTQNNKLAISQQYLKKELRDRFEFLHEDNQSFLQADTIIYHCFLQADTIVYHCFQADTIVYHCFLRADIIVYHSFLQADSIIYHCFLQADSDLRFETTGSCFEFGC